MGAIKRMIVFSILTVFGLGSTILVHSQDDVFYQPNPSDRNGNMPLRENATAHTSGPAWTPRIGRELQALPATTALADSKPDAVTGVIHPTVVDVQPRVQDSEESDSAAKDR